MIQNYDSFKPLHWYHISTHLCDSFLSNLIMNLNSLDESFILRLWKQMPAKNICIVHPLISVNELHSTVN